MPEQTQPTQPQLTEEQMLLLSLVRQNFAKTSRGYFSGFIRSHAETLHYLSEIGALKADPCYKNWNHRYRHYYATELDPPVHSCY